MSYGETRTQSTVGADPSAGWDSGVWLESQHSKVVLVFPPIAQLYKASCIRVSQPSLLPVLLFGLDSLLFCQLD